MGVATAAALATAAASAYGAHQQGKAAKDAAGAAQNASDAAIAEQQRQFDLTRQDQMPWLKAGQGALGLQQQFLAGDYGAALASPDYLARLDRGVDALDRGAASRGRLYSGGADADRMKFGADLATDGLNTYWNRLAGLSGTGQTTASSLGQMGMNMASNIGNNLWGAANARASGYQQRADANTQLGFGLAGIFNNWNQNRNPGGG
jgi:hypothetical protein